MSSVGAHTDEAKESSNLLRMLEGFVVRFLYLDHNIMP